MNLQLETLFLCLLSGLIVHVRAANFPISNLTCYECNTYRGSTFNPCAKNGPQIQRHACMACMKVHTRMEMHDFLTKPRVVVYESFTCVAKDFSIKPAGCYLSTGTQSLTKVCYCYTHLCNSARSHDSSRPVLASLLILSVFSSVKGLWSLML